MFFRKDLWVKRKTLVPTSQTGSITVSGMVTATSFLPTGKGFSTSCSFLDSFVSFTSLTLSSTHQMLWNCFWFIVVRRQKWYFLYITLNPIPEDHVRSLWIVTIWVQQKNKIKKRSSMTKKSFARFHPKLCPMINIFFSSSITRFIHVL